MNYIATIGPHGQIVQLNRYSQSVTVFISSRPDAREILGHYGDGIHVGQLWGLTLNVEDFSNPPELENCEVEADFMGTFEVSHKDDEISWQMQEWGGYIKHPTCLELVPQSSWNQITQSAAKESGAIWIPWSNKSEVVPGLGNMVTENSIHNLEVVYYTHENGSLSNGLRVPVVYR